MSPLSTSRIYMSDNNFWGNEELNEFIEFYAYLVHLCKCKHMYLFKGG